jgi:hypothetical protein
MSGMPSCSRTTPGRDYCKRRTPGIPACFKITSLSGAWSLTEGTASACAITGREQSQQDPRYSITSSALTNIDVGIVVPIALAV